MNPEPTDPAPATILVVDDEPLVRMGAADMFEDMGFHVLTAACGAEAIDLLGREPDVRLVFTDCRMPGMSGPELAETVSSRFPGVRVILTTGYASLPADVPWPVIWKPYGASAVEHMVRRELRTSPAASA